MKICKKHIPLLPLFLFLFFSMMWINPSPCEAASAKGPYLIISALNNNKTVAAGQNTIANGANINLRSANSCTAQLFYFKKEGKGVYSIHSYGNYKLVLSLSKKKGYSGCNVRLRRYTGAKNQLWRLKKTGKKNQYFIISKSGGYYLEISGGQSSNGANIRIHAGKKTKARRWYLKKAYSGTKAAKYALKYSDNSGKDSGGTYNKKFNRYETDCTNFISQCIYAGGLKTSKHWHPVFRGQACGTNRNYAWTMCTELYHHLVKNLHYKVTVTKKVTAKNVKVGDIVFMDTHGVGVVTHATIVSKISNGRAYYCGHTNWRRNRLYNGGFYKAYIVHMPS